MGPFVAHAKVGRANTRPSPYPINKKLEQNQDKPKNSEPKPTATPEPQRSDHKSTATPEPQRSDHKSTATPQSQRSDHKQSASGSPEPQRSGQSDPDSTVPPGICGRGKGTEKGYPEFEFGSMYQYMIPEVDGTPEPWKNDPAIPPEDVKIRILSVVASVMLGQVLNLEDIARKGINLHYNPGSFTPLKMRLKEPQVTAMFFSSGAMIVNGAKSEKECAFAAQRFVRILRKMGYSVSTAGLQIQNITATVNFGFSVRVTRLAECELLKDLTLRTETFSGVTVRMNTSKAKIIVFQTGRALITGIVSEKEAIDALNFIYPFARMYAR